MKKTLSYTYWFFGFLLFFGCSSTESTSSDPKGSDLITAELIEQSILHNGEEREYLAYVPVSYDENANYPILLNFHGFGENVKKLQ